MLIDLLHVSEKANAKLKHKINGEHVISYQNIIDKHEDVVRSNSSKPRLFLNSIQGNSFSYNLGNHDQFTNTVKYQKEIEQAGYSLDLMLREGFGVIGVGAIPVSKEGYILLQKRAQSKSVAPGLYMIPGGGHEHEKYGLDPKKSAEAELFEEQGISGVDLKYIGMGRDRIDSKNPAFFFYGNTNCDIFTLAQYFQTACDSCETDEIVFIRSDPESILRTISGSQSDFSGKQLDAYILGSGLGALALYGRAQYGEEFFKEAYQCLKKWNPGKKKMNNAKTTIYIAGPDVFYVDNMKRMEKFKQICADYGFLGLSPFDCEIESRLLKTKNEASYHIFKGNIELVHKSDIILANCNYFRNAPLVDDGTSFELGEGYATGNVLVGYSQDLSKMQSQALRFGAQLHKTDEGLKMYDREGFEIENFDNPFNLMLYESINENGFLVEGDFEAAVKLLHQKGFHNADFKDLRTARHELLVAQQKVNNVLEGMLEKYS